MVGYGAYKNKSNVDYDDAYHVVSTGDLVCFSASGENRVLALDAATGEVRWSFFTDAAPRLAPALWDGKAYLGADDGKARCLDLASGELIWEFDASPSGDRILGQGRFAASRPIRSGVLIDGGVAYFAAGLFPSEGVYLFALDARSGELLWKRPLDGSGNEAPSPQGYPLADDRSIFLPSRIQPTRWSKTDGTEIPFTTPVPKVKDSAYRYHNGGSYSLLWDRRFLVYGQAAILAFDPDQEYQDRYGRTVKGRRLFHWFNARRIVFRGDRAWLATDDHLLAVDTAKLADLAEHECRAFEEAYKKHNVARCREALEEVTLHGEDSERSQAILNGNLKYALPAYEQWPAVSEKLFAAIGRKTRWMTRASYPESLILAGDVLYAGGEGGLTAADAGSGEILWRTDTGSRVRGLAVANQRLFVSTVDGKVRCFGTGASAGEPKRAGPAVGEPIEPNEKAIRIVKSAIGAETEIESGFALLLGGDHDLAAALVRQTGFRIEMLETDRNRVASIRGHFAGTGWVGERITVTRHSGSELPFAPYLFNLVISGADSQIDEAELLRVTRPLGGRIFLAGRAKVDAAVGSEFSSTSTPEGLLLERGALPGAKNWTHNYGTPANRYCSDDQRVAGPFGILWYGEPGPRKRIDRHATPPMPLVVNGRMFVEGYDLLAAYDIYNGVKYWERWIPGVTRQQLPVGTSNLVADPAHLYVVAEHRRCLQLEAETGETCRTFPVPQLDGYDQHYWGWIAKEGGTLFGSRADADRHRRPRIDSNHAVFALDSESGKVKWLRGGAGIDNDSIAIDDGRLFLVDRDLDEAERAAALDATVKDGSVANRPAIDRRGNPIPPDLRKIVALDADTGKELWTRPFNFTDITLDDQALGTSHIGFSVLCMVSDGTLVVSGEGSLGHPYRQYQDGEFARRALYAFDAATGKILWGGRKNYRKRPVIIGNRIYAEPYAWDLRSGEQVMIENPLTGEPAPLDFLRSYSGCGHLVASGAAIFGNAGSGGMAHYNLGELSGYTPLGNLRLACGTGAVPAGGVFVAPEGRSGCACGTPIYTSVVLYPGKDRTDSWSFGAGGAEPFNCLPIRQVAINLGAPGFRIDEKGQLWLPYSGERFTGRFREWLPRHQHDKDMFYAVSTDLLPVEATETPWIYSSGYAAEKELVFPLLDPDRHAPAKFTVRLYFAEPEPITKGERVFDLSIQGKTVLPAFDIVGKAGAARRAIVETIEGVEVTGSLRISLERTGGTRPPVLCGFEVRLDNP